MALSFSLTLVTINGHYSSLNVILGVISYLKIIRLMTLNATVLLGAVIMAEFNVWKFLIKDNSVVRGRNGMS